MLRENDGFGMSFAEGFSGISEDAAAHPTKGWSQRQQRSRRNAIP
jgi:hypothetical protein